MRELSDRRSDFIRMSILSRGIGLDGLSFISIRSFSILLIIEMILSDLLIQHGFILSRFLLFYKSLSVISWKYHIDYYELGSLLTYKFI